MANIKISGAPYPLALTQSTTPNGTEIVPADNVASGIRKTFGFTFASLLGAIALNYGTGQVTVNQKTGLQRGLTVLAPNTSSFASLSVAGGTATSGSNDTFLYQDSSQNGYLGNNSSTGNLYLQTNAANRVVISSSGAVTVNTPSAATSLTVNGAASNYAVAINGAGAAGSNFGILIEAGLNNTDVALNITNSGATKGLLEVRGDGLVLASSQSIASGVTPSAAWQFDCTGGGSNTNQVSILTNGTYLLPVGSGIVYVYEISAALGVGQAFLFYGATSVTNITGSLYSGTIGTSGKVNFGYNGTQYYIQNLNASTVVLCISTIRLRTGN